MQYWLIVLVQPTSAKAIAVNGTRMAKSSTLLIRPTCGGGLARKNTSLWRTYRLSQSKIGHVLFRMSTE
jgi:hypothetical protein